MPKRTILERDGADMEMEDLERRLKTHVGMVLGRYGGGPDHPNTH